MREPAQAERSFTDLSAGELARLVAHRRVSARELVHQFLDRIAEVDPSVNALPVVLTEPALRQAAAADDAVRRGERLGPLHGVPFTVKLNIDVAGSATSWGVAALAENTAPTDAPVVERLRAAGAIPIARSNMPDLALRHDTSSSQYGRTANPTRPGATAGGSSGGEAAALAAHLTPLGLGNDLGGSLRSPAHCCGVVSLRPTPGVVPDAAATIPDVPHLAAQVLNVQGPMARSVADLELALGLLAGAHPRDAASGPRPAWPGTSSGRVAVLAAGAAGELHDEITVAVTAAADRLAEAGHQVVEVEPPHWRHAVEGWHTLTATALQPQLPLVAAVAGADALRFVTGAAAPPVDAAGLMDLLANRLRWSREWAASLAGFDVLLAPVWTRPAFEADLDLRDPLAVAAVVAPCAPAAFLGLPVVTVPIPVGTGSHGVQLIGARFREDLCLAVARPLEEM